VCAPNDQHAGWLLRHERFNLANGYSPEQFARVGLKSADTAAITLVRNDSLCNIAAITMSRDINAPDSTGRTIYMVVEGRFYIAIDRKLGGGEFNTGYLLDSTLTRVLVRYAM
jgi:hypothetical protein